MALYTQEDRGGSPASFQFATRAVHAGAHHDAQTGAVIAPISLSTTFGQNSAGKPIGGYDYTRSGNPNR